MAVSLVSQHGPNPQSSKPDRSVSLPVPDPRETAVTMMGGIGNLPLKRLQKQRVTLIDRYEKLKPDSPNTLYNQELDELLDAIEAVEEEIRKMQPPPPPPPVDVWDLDDPAQRKAALEKYGAQHLNPVPEYEPDLPPDTVAMGAMAPTMMAHMASGEPGRIGRASPEGPVPDYEPPSPMSDEERRRALEEIEKIRRDNEDVLNPGSTMMATLMAAMNQPERPIVNIPTGGEGWATRPWNMPPIEELPPWPGEIPNVDWPKPPLEWDEIKGDIGGEIEQPGGWEPLPGDEGFNPMDMLGSIFGSVVDAIPDVDPQTAITVAFVVAAALAAGSGVGSPMVPLILGGGAALASQ